MWTSSKEEFDLDASLGVCFMKSQEDEAPTFLFFADYLEGVKY